MLLNSKFMLSNALVKLVRAGVRDLVSVANLVDTKDWAKQGKKTTKGEIGKWINREVFCYAQCNINYLIDHLVLLNKNGLD